MSLNLTKLTVKRAVFYAYHGVNKAEKEIGGRYEVDIDLYYDSTQAILSDNVKFAINYEEVMYVVSEVIQNHRCNLIETVANKIVRDIISKFDILEKVTVRLRKLNVPIHRYIDYIEVEQTKERNTDNTEEY